MKYLDKFSTIDLIKRIQSYENQIEILINERNYMIDELYRRLPVLEKEEEFKKKVLRKEN